MSITTNRYLILFLLFLAASISYAIGFIGGFWAFIIIGGVLEFSFWASLLSRYKRRRKT